MTDDRLRQLIDQPPRDPERVPDPAFTAAVMGRIASQPIPRRTQPLAFGVAALVAVAISLLPLDSVPSIDELSAWIDGETLIELCAAAAVAGVVLVIHAAPRRIDA